MNKEKLCSVAKTSQPLSELPTFFEYFNMCRSVSANRLLVALDYAIAGSDAALSDVQFPKLIGKHDSPVLGARQADWDNDQLIDDAGTQQDYHSSSYCKTHLSPHLTRASFRKRSRRYHRFSASD